METLENRSAEKHLHKTGKQILGSGNNTPTPTHATLSNRLTKKKAKERGENNNDPPIKSEPTSSSSLYPSK
jgi:hypothetical protein